MDGDFALALSLQEEISSTFSNNDKNSRKRARSTSIVDPCLETIDPTPDARQLFLEFNDAYFWGKLSSCEVLWSNRMTVCAGLCCYEGRGGLCTIKLSMPLLKLRPRKNLVETLLHEMIHALLFVTNNNKDHDGHGPEFHKHMYRINQLTGTNITVYHNFHDEVKLYQQHWWRCDGPCQRRPPYFGFVKRSMNRAPSPNDLWWADHQRKCGGTYTKVKEPDDYGNKKRKVTKDEPSKIPGRGSKDKSLVLGMPKIDKLWKDNRKSVHDETKPKTGLGTKGESAVTGTPAIHDFGKIPGFGSKEVSGKPKMDDLWSKEDTSSTADKENIMQKSNNKSDLQVIVPFSGKGSVLGGTSSHTVTQPWLAEKAKSKSSDRKNGNGRDITNFTSFNINKNSSRSITSGGNKKNLEDKQASGGPSGFFDQNKHEDKGKKDGRKLGSNGTIIDAFRRVEKSEKDKAIVIIDDSAAKLVACPLCQEKVKEIMINSHLDKCLTK